MTGRELVELAGRLQGLAAARRARRAPPRRSSGSGWPTRPTAGSAAIRAGCASGSGSPRRSSPSRSLLILDEPVSSLDPEGRRDLLALIAELRERATVIFSTHVLADVERICDRVGDPRPRPAGHRGAARRAARPLRPAALPARPGARAGRAGRGAGRDRSARGPVGRPRRPRRERPRSSSVTDADARLGRSCCRSWSRPASGWPPSSASGRSLEDVFLRLVGRGTRR